MINVSYVKPEMVDIIWPQVENMVELAVAESNEECSADEIKFKLEQSIMLMATITKDGKIVAALTFDTRVFESGKKVLLITTAGGTLLAEWMDAVDKVTMELAKRQGCSELYIIGRKGWLRTLKDVGYSHVHTVLSKKVGE